MAVDRDAEEQLEIADIQGDVLIGLQKDAELFVGFVILDVARFKRFLRGLPITSCRDVKLAGNLIASLKANKRHERLDIRGVNIGFTIDGLEKLGAPDLGKITDQPFRDRLSARSSGLNDPPEGPGALENWLVGNGVGPLDGMLLLTGKDLATVRAMFGDFDNAAGPDTWRPFFTGEGVTRPDPFRGHEHFDFLDGVSQPAIRGRIDAALPGEKFLNPSQNPKDPNQGLPGADLNWPGAFVFGYQAQDRQDVETPAQPAHSGADWMRNGSYMVYRRLEQLVPEFKRAVHKGAADCKMDPTLFGARVVGRFESGWPVIKDGKDNKNDGGRPLLNNDFEFGDADEDGAKCPFAAHIRKSYPRNDDTPNGGEPDTQTHRIMRAGIPFGPEVSDEETKAGRSAESRGLMFVCYQTSIDNQFEFIIKNWVNEPGFAKDDTGFDPLLGQAPGADRTREVGGLCEPGSRTMFDADFIRPTGGGYFFMPSISAIAGVLSV